MADFRFQERVGSGDFTLAPDHVVLKYVAGRSNSESYIAAYSLSASPSIYNNLYRESLTAKALGGGMWHVDIPYGPDPPASPNAYQVQYDTTGGTARKTQALEHIASYARATKTAPAHAGAVNVAPDGRAEGVDVPVPSFKWSETHILPISIAGWVYAQVLKGMTAHTNAGAFRGFPKGEVLFLGATGAYSSAADSAAEIGTTFNFEQTDSVSGLTYDQISGVAKTGHEYLWFEHAQEDDSTANRLKSPLIAVHRERMLDPADFGLLQIGS